jgi:hypothetical protein
VYEKYSSNKNVVELMLMIPPADVAWLWHCHRLAPLRYISFLKHRFGKDCPILEANPPFKFQLRECGSSESTFHLQGCSSEHQTRALWKQRYPEEPFEISIQSAKGGSEQTSESLCLNGFDLLGSTERQGSFLWQVSAPRFQDPHFLDQGVDNYHRFLQLRKYAPSQTIVPTYQIDLMWHTHILASMQAYQEDCLAIIGTSLHHDDSLNDRTEGGALDTAFYATKVLWKEQYHQDYHVCGGMYRGEPPESFSHPEWSPLHDASNDAPLGPFLKMIGVQGATSTNPTETWTWTPINGISPDGKPGFQSPAEKSKKVGVNANTAKEAYIFGKPTSGAVGYYHSSTREFYDILLKRISRRVTNQEDYIAQEQCMAGCLSCGMANTTPSLQRVEAKLEELKDVKKIVLARSVADFPVGAKGAPKDLKRDKARYSAWYGNGGEWNIPSDCYAAGGGELIVRFIRSLLVAFFGFIMLKRF